MLLTIDVGNTNMVFAIFRGEEMIGSFRLRTDGQATSDEIGLMAQGINGFLEQLQAVMQKLKLES